MGVCTKTELFELLCSGVVFPHPSLPHPASEYQSTALREFKHFAQTLMRHRRWDMELGSRFLQYDQCTEASLLRHFHKRVRQCYTNLHTSIATSRRRIILWRRQGTFLLDYYDTLMETCKIKKENLWVQSLRTLRHWSMQQLTKVATHLLRENWSIVEDLFRAPAATMHHLQKRSLPCTSEYSNPKRVRMPRIPQTSSESELR